MRDNLVYIDGYSQVINGQKQTDHKLNLAYELGEQEGKQGAEMVRKVLKDNFRPRYQILCSCRFPSLCDCY